MVKPFQFARVPKIHFKKGAIADLPEIVRLYGFKIALVTGRNSFIQTVQAEKLFKDFEKQGVQHIHIVIPGEPSPEIIDLAVSNLRSESIDLVVGIGGGSVLDAGKAISAMMYKSESVLEFLEGVGIKEHPGTKLPVIAVPTTSGTGSEATKNAVISQIGKNGYKRSLRHENFVPDIALVDPELTLQCPREITAASGMDCFTQLTEAYLSAKASAYTDALAFEGLREIKKSLVESFNNGENIQARSGMSFAALTSGICLANAGLGVVHGFASSIGGRYNIPHGLICGTLMASANEINVKRLRAMQDNTGTLGKYVLLGKLFLEEDRKTDSYYIDGFIDYLYSLSDKLELSGLKKAGLNEKDLREICQATECKNNPVKLSTNDLFEIIKRRFH
jgi:alcohol dehydrogenase class IV